MTVNIRFIDYKRNSLIPPHIEELVLEPGEKIISVETIETDTWTIARVWIMEMAA